MKYKEKTSRFLELCKIDDPTPEESMEYSKLYRELSARGLNPQQIDGLAYRTLVYDNRKAIQLYLDLTDSKKGKDATPTKYELRGLGIDTRDKQGLRKMLASFITNASAIDRKKTTRCVGIGRRSSDIEWQQEEDEMIGEEIAARQNRQALGSFA